MNFDSIIEGAKQNPWLVGGGVLIALGAFYWLSSAPPAEASDANSDGLGYVNYGGFQSPTLYGGLGNSNSDSSGGSSGLDMTALLGLQSQQSEYDYQLGLAGIDAQNRLTASNLEIARLNAQANLIGIQANLYQALASKPDQYNVGTIQFDPITSALTVNTLNINSRWLGETNVQAFTRQIWSITNARTPAANGTVPLPSGSANATQAPGGVEGSNPYAPAAPSSYGSEPTNAYSPSYDSPSGGGGERNLASFA